MNGIEETMKLVMQMMKYVLAMVEIVFGGNLMERIDVNENRTIDGN
jgi:hypothetical protein